MAGFADTPTGAEDLRTEPLQVLYEEPGLPHWRLPPALTTLYGGDLGFTEPRIYANFVASLDGVVALGPEHPHSGSTISGRKPADRFVMGLLRSCADAVVIGAGTLRASPHHHWTPQHVYPTAAGHFAELRHRRGRPADPELIVVTARGALPASHPAFQAGAVVITTTPVARDLRGSLPASCTLLAAGPGPRLSMGAVLDAVHARGHRVLLTEGGPYLVGQLMADSLLDELFLTIAPVPAGRADSPRPGLVAGQEFLPARRPPTRLVSTRRCGSYLFLRYRFHHAISEGSDPHPHA
ncbi:dihydrofolate reductase family protein [Streptomyces sp. NPDC048196]|uniref:dihydrofolate reductase family protein n=1 Tax=Streptomyces sp. NPDC048196 TaxID=3154712 RepID=UPI0033EA8FD1